MNKAGVTLHATAKAIPSPAVKFQPCVKAQRDPTITNRIHRLTLPCIRSPMIGRTARQRTTAIAHGGIGGPLADAIRKTHRIANQIMASLASSQAKAPVSMVNPAVSMRGSSVKE